MLLTNDISSLFQVELSNMTVEPSYRIIVKGLASNVDENAFELAFAKYGRIMEGRTDTSF